MEKIDYESKWRDERERASIAEGKFERQWGEYQELRKNWDEMKSTNQTWKYAFGWTFALLCATILFAFIAVSAANAPSIDYDKMADVVVKVCKGLK